MEKSHNGPKCAKTYENDTLELIFLIVQLDKDLLEEEQVFIAQAKGRSGWGLHPYTLKQQQ